MCILSNKFTQICPIFCSFPFVSSSVFSKDKGKEGQPDYSWQKPRPKRVALLNEWIFKCLEGMYTKALQLVMFSNFSRSFSFCFSKAMQHLGSKSCPIGYATSSLTSC